MLDNRSRLILEANFIFSLWKNPKYYHMFLKKMVTDPSVFFKNKSSLFYFSIGEQMATKGYQVFDVATVVAYISGYPELQEEFETYGGYATVAKIMEKVSEENRETYFIEIMKANCIDSLNAQGLINSEEEKAIAEMTIEEMRLFYTNKVNKIFYKQGATVKVQDTFIDDEDIEKLDSGAEMGLNIGNTSPLLNYEILGLNTGLTFVGGTVNTGKTSFIMGIMVRSFLKSKLKCCVISNEQGLLEFKRIMLAMAVWELYGDQTDLTRRRIKIGNYNTMEKGVMMEAKDYCNEHYAKYMKFVEMPDYCIEEVRMIIDYLTPMGFGGFIYDVFKAETNQMQVVNEMKTMSNNLFLTSKSNNVSTVATIQLGLSYNHVRHLTMETISTSKHITEPATEVLLMRPMWSDEVTGGAYDINIYNYLYDKHGQVMKDGSGKPLKKPIHIEGDDYKDVILLFLAKTRNTRKGTCIAYRFNGDYNIWEELGYCTPSMEDKTK